MASAREQVVQAMRAWLIQVTALPPIRVIPADDKGTRPPMPYLTVKVVVPDIPVGTGELLHSLDGATGEQRVQVRAHARATVQVDAYGAGAADLLTAARIAIDSPVAMAALRPSGVSVARALGPTRDLTGLRDTGWEERASRDFEVTYALQTAQETVETAETIEVGVVLAKQADDPDPITRDIDYEV